ncbi:MAG: SDR family NAD(P)-dependent oxidoreductase [Bacillota bacterium]
MDYGLKGKVALITGAAQGIGKGAAEVFSELGCDLALFDLKEEGLKETASALEKKGTKVLPLPCDVSDEARIDACMQVVVERFGRIDVLVNCAGVTNSSLLYEIPTKEWDRIISINAKSIYMVSQRAAKIMIEKKIPGRIVSVSSQASKIGEYGNGVYCCSKAMVNMFTQVLALELAPFNITVNAVCPGYVDTEIMQRVFRERGPLEGMTAKEYEEHLLSRVPLRRMVTPREIGEFMAFLASDNARYITGTAQTIAGGSTLI